LCWDWADLHITDDSLGKLVASTPKYSVEVAAQSASPHDSPKTAFGNFGGEVPQNLLWEVHTGHYPELSETVALNADVRRNFRRSKHLLSVIPTAIFGWALESESLAWLASITVDGIPPQRGPQP
jgi:hypothetical protein